MSPQTRFKKFQFERSFDDPGKLYLPGERRNAQVEAESALLAAELASRETEATRANTNIATVLPPEPSAEEVLKGKLEAAREEGYVQGHTAALEEAETAREHYIAEAMTLIGQGVDNLGVQQTQAYDQLANDAMRLVYAIVKRLLPPVAQNHAAETIGEFVKQVLPLAISEPKLVVRAHSMITADLESRLQDIGDRAGFRGTFAVVPDYELQPGDCRIEWDGGGAERNEARIWREMRAQIAATLGDIDTEALDHAADQPAESAQDTQTDGGTPAA